jgi:hypothetical protein
MGQRLAVSEFPNDNPELHDGLVWAAPTPCAPALPTLRLRPGAPARVLRPEWEPRSDPRASAAPILPPSAPSSVSPPPEVLEIEVAVVEPEPPAVQPELLAEPEPPAQPEPLEVTTTRAETPEAPSSTNGFEAFVAALAAILAERAATRAAANVGALLGRARLARDAFDAGTKKVLVARGILDAKTSRPTPEFSVVAHAWREVLDGSSADLSACGSTTLDVWGAELLAALLSIPRERADDLRRALRQRGVAAFGMLATA